MVQSTKGTILFPTGEAKPSRAQATIRFKLTGGLPQVPSGPRYVSLARFSGKGGGTAQLICDFNTEPDDNGVVRATVFFHGDNPPPLAFKTGTHFVLLAGDLITASGIIVQGEPASPPGTTFSIPPLPT